MTCPRALDPSNFVLPKQWIWFPIDRRFFVRVYVFIIIFAAFCAKAVMDRRPADHGTDRSEMPMVDTLRFISLPFGR